ncbi:hypothetical protein RQP46_009289 [Phenoliferia psychrophenolica]
MSIRTPSLHPDYVLSSSPELLHKHFDAIHHTLTTHPSIYWGQDRTKETFTRQTARSWRSLVVVKRGTELEPEALAGFARVVSDGEDFGYLADVFVLPEHQKKGIAQFMIKDAIENSATGRECSKTSDLWKWCLLTKVSHPVPRCRASTHALTMNMTGVDVQPLLSWQPTVLDIVLPPLLIATSLLLHTLYNSPPPTSTHESSHLFRAKTAHARLLPASARHVFCYPVLYFGLDLARLEAGELDLGKGRGSLFGWEPPTWVVAAFWRHAYLEAGAKTGIRDKVLALLERRGIDTTKDATMIYMVSMPAYLGFEGINPLTVHYCYGDATADAKRPLRVVVLEVHNTFGERHVYVLRVGVDEDTQVSLGYDHQWTFPRAFHVSPFNSRVGFYRVSLSSPFATSLTHPTLATKIVFLTPTREKKLYAALAGPGEPLVTPTLLKALFTWPLGLLLTTPRILWQAGRLSYGRGLAVWIRPEPFAGEHEGRNPVQDGAEKGSVGWQEEGAMEKWAREKVRKFLSAGVKDGVRVVLRSADESVEDMEFASEPARGEKERLLLVTYLTPLFFTDLAVSPSIPLALAVGSHTEHRWSTNDDPLFLEVFNFTPTSHPPPFLSRLAQSLRCSLMAWGLSFAAHPRASPPTATPHPLDDATISTVWTLFLHYAFLRMGYSVFSASRASVVEGTESWAEWARWNEGQLERESLVKVAGK